MNPSSAQEVVARFVEANGMEMSPESRLLDLVSEVGEAAKAILKETDYGRTEFQPNSRMGGRVGRHPVRPHLPRQRHRRRPGKGVGSSLGEVPR